MKITVAGSDAVFVVVAATRIAHGGTTAAQSSPPERSEEIVSG